jgi:hypothetical protein
MLKGALPAPKVSFITGAPKLPVQVCALPFEAKKVINMNEINKRKGRRMWFNKNWIYAA